MQDGELIVSPFSHCNYGYFFVVLLRGVGPLVLAAPHFDSGKICLVAPNLGNSWESESSFYSEALRLSLEESVSLPGWPPDGSANWLGSLLLAVPNFETRQSRLRRQTLPKKWASCQGLGIAIHVVFLLDCMSVGETLFPTALVLCLATPTSAFLRFNPRRARFRC